MVKKNLYVVCIFFIFKSLSISCFANPKIKKRFIVRYKTQKQVLGNKRVKSIQRTIVEGKNFQDVKNHFPLGQQNIESIEEDTILKATLVPGDSGSGDPLYFEQWHYFDNDGGIDLPLAWNISTGDSGIVVAVLDTGITVHRDLRGNVLPGADLISDRGMSNDGDGRDTNAADSGDWIAAGDPCYTGQNINSTWHGTHVAGTIAANSDNGVGITGVAWNVKILPVRVLGKCGGYLSDIADGIRWAAGGSVNGLPLNNNKADVINLSLGGAGVCGPTMQSAIDFAVSQGVVIVVAAGNESQNLNYTSYVPATCRNVITVGAGNKYASKSHYSNYGDYVDVMAPGGDNNDLVLSTINTGSTLPSSESYSGMMGTSMAAPHVAGVVALIKSVKKKLYPAQIENILKETTKYFDCYEGCGRGLISAHRALELATITEPDSSYRGIEPISRFPSYDSGEQISVYREERGGMCGSVGFIKGPRPPKGGKGGFVVSLLFGILFALSLFGLSQKKSN